MYLHIKNDIQSPDLAFINQESPIGGIIDHFQDLRTSILRVRLLKMLSKPALIWSMVPIIIPWISDEGVLNHLKTWNKLDKQVLFTGILIRKRMLKRYQL